jgi:hypothetical protein
MQSFIINKTNKNFKAFEKFSLMVSPPPPHHSSLRVVWKKYKYCSKNLGAKITFMYVNNDF